MTLQLIDTIKIRGAITDVGATQLHDLGTTIRTTDGKEYMYVKAAAAITDTGTAVLNVDKCLVVWSDRSAFTVTTDNTLANRYVAGKCMPTVSITINYYFWIQTKGLCTLVSGNGARAIVAGEGIVLDDDADTGKIGGVNLDVTATVNQTNVNATLVSIHGIIGTSTESEAVADQDVAVILDCPASP